MRGATRLATGVMALASLVAIGAVVLGVGPFAMERMPLTSLRTQPDGAAARVGPGDPLDGEAEPSRPLLHGVVIQGAEQVPLAEVEIRLAGEGDVALDQIVASGRSRSDGRFTLAGVPAGVYRLAAFPAQARPVVVTGITVPSEGLEGELVVPFPGAGAMARAEAAESEDGESPGNEAVTEAVVGDVFTDLVVANTPTWQVLTDSGPSGEMVLWAAPDATSHRLVFSSSGASGAMELTLSAAALSVEDALERVDRDAQSPQGDQPDPARGTIRGLVLDRVTGQPLSRAAVRVIGRERREDVRSGEDGTFRVRNLDPGEYAVTLEGLQGGSLFQDGPANVIVRVDAGQVVDAYLQASRAVRITGIAGDDTQAAAAGLQAGDVILKYGDEMPTSESHLRELRAAVPEDQPVTMVVQRGGAQIPVEIHGGQIGVYTEVVYW